MNRSFRSTLSFLLSFSSFFSAFFSFFFLATGSAQAGFFQCVGGDCEGTGFAVYRTKNPDREILLKACGPWQTDFIVMNDDDIVARTLQYRGVCPNANVVYAKNQDAHDGMDTPFLSFVDRVMERGQREGRKIVFHCKIGTHRTGRLAAYMELKYFGLELKTALQHFKKHISTLTRLAGFSYNRSIKRQIVLLDGHLRGEDLCSQTERKKECIKVRTKDEYPDPALDEAERRFESGT